MEVDVYIFQRVAAELQKEKKEMSHDTTKPKNGMCTQQRLKSVWASPQSE